MGNKLPKIISQDEFERLFNEIQKRETKAKTSEQKKRYKELKLCVLLGFEAGMRISEIVGHTGISKRTNKKTKEVVEKKIEIKPLSKDQVTDNSIKIIDGKGGKDRIVPKPKRMNQTAINMLPLKIPRRTIQELITRIGFKVLNRQITFHTLRHGFGSHLASNGRPLHEIQLLMGHSRIDTTGIYLHANPEEAIKSAQDVF